MKISILTPTRNRPERMKTFIDSVYENCTDKSNLYFYNYIDSDDSSIEKYQMMFSQLNNSNCYTTYGEPMSVSKSWDIIANRAIEDGTDILIMGNDDLIYRTPDWDSILLEKIKMYPDNIYCAYFDDMIWSDGKHCAFPVVSKEWFEVVGHFSSGLFHFLYNDTWIFDIAKKIDRVIYIPEVVSEHMHHSVKKGPMDIDLKNRKAYWALDRPIWNKTEVNRKQIADRLKIYIDEKNNSL